jgi:hypothetical protein
MSVSENGKYTGHATAGFRRKALAMSGAKRVALKFTVPFAQAGPYSELAMTWQWAIR